MVRGRAKGGSDGPSKCKRWRHRHMLHLMALIHWEGLNAVISFVVYRTQQSNNLRFCP
jgi:hypothetical protein